MKKLAVVTGGAGFIGSHLVDDLVRRGWSVAVLDDLSTGVKGNVNPRARLHVADIRTPKAARLIEKLKPDVVFHLAAQVSVPISLDQPVRDADINLLATVRLMEAASDAGVKRFVLASSAAVFPTKASRIPTDESEPVGPQSPYGIAKYADERYGLFFRTTRGLPFVALRFANVYGPRQSQRGEAGVVAVFAKRMLTDQDVMVNGSGKQTRDFIYVGDAVRAMVAAANDPHAEGPYHVGTGVETTIADLYRRLSDATGYTKKPRRGPADVNAPYRSALDSKRIRRELGWKPTVGLDEGIRKTVTWFRKNA
jgi:UDP-glucose 4-epimerase